MVDNVRMYATASEQQVEDGDEVWPAGGDR
jgi:hypothetical protein